MLDEALTEIVFAFEAARDSLLPYDCFGLVMRQGHILKGASRPRTSGWSICAITGCLF